MSTETPTITVAGYFGDKQVTKQEFVKQWVDHAHNLLRLDYTKQWQNSVQVIENTVEAKAKEEFSKMLVAQSKEI